MDAIALDQLIQQCAVGVAPSTMAAIVKVESGGNPYAIGDNTARSRVTPSPKSAHEAARVALELLRLGHSLDLGLAQINSKNLKAHGVSVEDVFEPCTNLKVGSTILSNFYLKSVEKYGVGEVSLFHALSAYNTGSFYRGPDYVGRILSAAGSKASISKVAWKQSGPSSQSKQRQQSQYTYRPYYSPIIAFSHVENDDSSLPSNGNSILAISQ